MKKIPLRNKNKEVANYAIVDDKDFESLNKWRWNKTTDGYAKRWVSDSLTIRMHREILGAKKGEEVDHINGDRLDNRRSNLRLCSHTQNSHNRKKTKGISRFKGLRWREAERKWEVSIMKDGERLWLGSFLNEITAAKAYNKMAKKLFGQFAWLNEFDCECPCGDPSNHNNGDEDGCLLGGVIKHNI